MKKKNPVDSKFWLIPPEIYDPLNKEFKFDFDPCPYPFKRDGIGIDWGKSNWVNPPFRKIDSINGHGPTAFVRKAIEEFKKGKTSVIILPVQSYVNMLLEAGAELRPAGRVRWLDAITGKPYHAPGHNALFILRKDTYGDKIITKVKDLKDYIKKAKVGKVIDEITYGCDVVLNETACCGDISFGNEILLCNKCRVYYDKIQNIKQKLGIK